MTNNMGYNTYPISKTRGGKGALAADHKPGLSEGAKQCLRKDQDQSTDKGIGQNYG